MADERPLPYGWVKEFDDNYQQYFYVDTKAEPLRSIWVHPYEDEQYLREHPDVREKVSVRHERPAGPPPDGRPPSYRGDSSRTPADVAERERKGFFGKLKDKTIGTKEEREARRRAEQRMEEERRQRALEAQRQRQQQQQQAYNRFPQQGYAQPGFGSGFGGGGGFGRAPQDGYYPQQGYYPPQQAPAQRRTGLGGMGGGMALPLIGGLAGGFLLGEALDGGDGGDFGGGDGGGDFGGGDF